MSSIYCTLSPTYLDLNPAQTAHLGHYENIANSYFLYQQSRISHNDQIQIEATVQPWQLPRYKYAVDKRNTHRYILCRYMSKSQNVHIDSVKIYWLRILSWIYSDLADQCGALTRKYGLIRFTIRCIRAQSQKDFAFKQNKNFVRLFVSSLIFQKT